jgi:hypothetical protein
MTDRDWDMFLIGWVAGVIATAVIGFIVAWWRFRRAE